jgi:predicted Zn-dependent protease
MKECKKLIRLNPLDAEGLFFLDRLCEQAGTDGGLEPLFAGLLREMPERNTVRLAMAKRRMRENNLTEAESLIAREERRFGVSPASRFMNSLLLRAKGDAKNAASLFEKLFAENPENGEYAYHVAECLRESGQTQKAKGMYDTAWRKSDGKGREWIRTKIAVRTAEMNGASSPEHETLEKFIGMDTENGSLAYARASALERAGMRDAAHGAFQAVAMRGGNDAIRGAALFRLARLTPNGGRDVFLRQCLKLLPDHRGAKNLLGAETKNG